MEHNEVCELVELPEGCKRDECKWIFKIKRDSKGNIELYKAKLIAKGFTQKGGIDYKKTFSLVSKNDSFRIIMALVAHYDFELYQIDVKTIDVKTTILNGNLEEEIYMDQLEGFFQLKEGNTWCVSLRNQYMDVNKLPKNGIWNQ